MRLFGVVEAAEEAVAPEAVPDSTAVTEEPEQDYADEIALSQRILQIERRAGVVKGVSAERLEEPAAPVETDRSIVLRTIDDKLAMDLRRYRNVHHIRGVDLGVKGARALGASLTAGACPRLSEIDLSYSKIQVVGLASLVEAFAKKCTLTSLGLAANHLGAGAVDLVARVSAKLVSLDLRHNVLRNDGACRLASALLAGKFVRLQRLDLRHNDIMDRGLRAMVAAATAAAKPCPELVALNLRFNKPRREESLGKDQPLPLFVIA